MPYAQVLTTASKANLTGGGGFADSLTAQGTDSLAVANFNAGSARILEMWGANNAHTMEVQAFYTRPEATHDQQHGYRAQVPATTYGAVAARGSFNLLGGNDVINLFKSDTLTLQVAGTNADNASVSFMAEYDDLPGASAVFMNPGQVNALHKSKVGINVVAVASGTAGAYGTARAFNADDDRLHANTWYAIVGWTVSIAVQTISLIGPDWGGQRIGGPGGLLYEASSSWFVDQSQKWNKPLVPAFNSNNKGNVLVQVVDVTTSTSPLIDFNLVELTGMPG